MLSQPRRRTPNLQGRTVSSTKAAFLALLAVFFGFDFLGGPAHTADLAGFKKNAILGTGEGHGLGHVHAASLDVP